MKNTLIKIDFTTYLFILLAFLAGYIKNILLIYLIIIIHELGHFFFFRLFKIDVLKIVIYPFGGITYINKKIHERIYKTIFCSLGGLLFQLVLFLIFSFLFSCELINSTTFLLFKTYNKALFIFNLLPIIPLDGSKIYFSFLTKFFSYKLSYSLMLILNLFFLILFSLYNFIFKINDLILISFLVFEYLKEIKNYKYILNKFYLERVLNKHYYNAIVNNCSSINKFRLDKYYYIKDNNKYINEKDYLLSHYFVS